MAYSKRRYAYLMFPQHASRAGHVFFKTAVPACTTEDDSFGSVNVLPNALSHDKRQFEQLRKVDSEQCLRSAVGLKLGLLRVQGALWQQWLYRRDFLLATRLVGSWTVGTVKVVSNHWLLHNNHPLYCS